VYHCRQNNPVKITTDLARTKTTTTTTYFTNDVSVVDPGIFNGI
jgi:hypothetical protein